MLIRRPNLLCAASGLVFGRTAPAILWSGCVAAPTFPRKRVEDMGDLMCHITESTGDLPRHVTEGVGNLKRPVTEAAGSVQRHVTEPVSLVRRIAEAIGDMDNGSGC